MPNYTNRPSDVKFSEKFLVKSLDYGRILQKYHDILGQKNTHIIFFEELFKNQRKSLSTIDKIFGTSIRNAQLASTQEKKGAGALLISMSRLFAFIPGNGRGNGVYNQAPMISRLTGVNIFYASLFFGDTGDIMQNF